MSANGALIRAEQVVKRFPVDSNRLLRSGATALTSAADVLETFGIEPESPPAPPDLSDPATRILARLEVEPAGADALARALELDAGDLAAALTELELAGVVSERDGFFRLAAGLRCRRDRAG